MANRATSHGPSFLRWAGSKRQSLGKLKQAVPVEFDRYVEPFAGSAALFFAIKPSSASLSDLNGSLVNAMQWVRDDHSAVLALLRQMDRDCDSYYLRRAELNEASGDDVRSAALFIYVNRNCFNGLWRTNREGRFNVPYGGTAIGNYPPDELFADCAETLKRATIQHQDFRLTLSETGAGDFIYADPPYFTATERTFVEYGKKSFGAKDLSDLIEMLAQAEARGAKIALTYSSAMAIDNLPTHWMTRRFDVTRNVGGFKGSRRLHGEFLYTNAQADVS